MCCKNTSFRSNHQIFIIKECLKRQKIDTSIRIISNITYNIPEIGYLSLSVDLDMDELKPDNKVRADYVSVRGIKFRPNEDLLKQVKYHTHFEKSQYTSHSYPFSEDTLKEKIREYMKDHRSINRRTLEMEFHIRKQTALNWLKQLEKSGFLIKEGSRNAPVYFLAEE